MELICRRAFNDKSGKIFTVLNADNMDFDCGVHIETLFRKHEARNKEYRLIFVVSKEREHSSYIATAMAAMAVTIPNLPPIAEVQRYLLRHLKVSPTPKATAARHDPDRARFRLVASRQAGNGKSLLCRRIKEKERASSTLQIQEISYTEIVTHWLGTRASTKAPHVYHLDISMGVESGRNDPLFSLAVLGGLVDRQGKVWLCSDSDLYLVEVTLPELRNLEEVARDGSRKRQSFCLALPLILCEPPRDDADMMSKNSFPPTYWDSSKFSMVDVISE